MGIRWHRLLQYDIDGPVTLTLACSTSLAALLATFGYLIAGIEFAMWFSPLGALAGAALALRYSGDASMQKWSHFADRAMGHCAKVLFLYGLSFWIHVVAKYGLGFAGVLMGGLSALLWFAIGGVTGLIVAVAHVLR